MHIVVFYLCMFVLVFVCVCVCLCLCVPLRLGDRCLVGLFCDVSPFAMVVVRAQCWLSGVECSVFYLEALAIELSG